MTRQRIALTVLVAALGYFVDIYDLLLFGILRIKSLKELGVADDRILDVGAHIFNMQMGGMLLGGILWGVLGDKRGRLSVLFGSILMYSVATFANGFVTSVPQYAWLRLIAGIGLAGELGAGITLVCEIIPKEARGWGATIVATVGISGGVVAALVGDLLAWRHSYMVGGALGICLLVLRIGMFESGMFERALSERVERGSFLALFTSRERLVRYLAVVMVGLPLWYVVGILVVFGHELGKSLGLDPAPNAGRSIMFCYIGLALGDLATGTLSQILRTRKKVVALCLTLIPVAVTVYFLFGGSSLTAFYASCFLLGLPCGYWVVFVTMASEHFGTNLRATVTTTAPNFVRGAVVPVTLLFQALKGTLGVQGSALAVGALTMLVAILAFTRLHETFGRDLDYVEVI